MKSISLKRHGPRTAGFSLDEASERLAEEHGGEIFGLVFEDLATRRYGSKPHNLVDDLLQNRGAGFRAQAREYLEALRDSAPCIHEVIGVRPGEGMTVRNQFVESHPVEVIEIAGSRQMVEWDRIAARVVSVRGVNIFTGALIPFRAPEADKLVAQFREALQASVEAGHKQLSRDAFRARAHEAARVFAPVIGRSRMKLLLDSAKNPVPALHNRDGDPVEFIDATHAVAAGKRRAIIAALDSEPKLVRSGARPPTWDWTGRVQSTSRTSAGPETSFEIDMHDPHDPAVVLLGSVTLSRGRLVVSVNSRSRLSRLMEFLQQRIAGLVGTAKIRSSAAETLADADEGAGAPRRRPGKVERELMARHLEAYYRSWIDEPIPALGGRTPRAAAQDFEGRQQLVSLLRYMENMQARASRDVQRYEFGALWRALGIERRRS